MVRMKLTVLMAALVLGAACGVHAADVKKAKPAPVAPLAAATVEGVQLPAWVERGPNGVRQPLAPGAVLGSQDNVLTGPNARLLLRMADGSTAVIYDVTQLSGARTLLAERFKPDGSWESFDAAPKREAMPATLWRIDRGMRADAGTTSEVIDTLEDTPFYARSLLRTHLLGEQVTAVHETLEPQRLKSRVVQMMLPFRMPRRAGGG